MPESAQQTAASATPPVQGPVQAPSADAPPQPPTVTSAPAPSKTGLESYDLGNTDILYEELPVAAVQGSAPPPLPPRGENGRFVSPTAAPAPELPAASQQHSQYLVGLARDLGFSEEEISQTPRETLERDIYLLNRRLRAEGRADTKTDTVQGDRAQVPQDGNLPPAAEPSWDEEEIDLPEAGGKAKLKDALHPALTKTLGKLFKRLDEQDATIKHLSAAESNRQNEAVYTAIDRLFVSRADLFGDKVATQLTPDDPHMRKRSMVVRLMKTFEKGTMKERFEAAVRDLYGESKPQPPSGSRPTAPAPAPPQNGHSRITPEQWNEGALAAPTHRNGGSEPPGVDRASKVLAAKLRELDSQEDEAADKDFRP